MSFGVMGKHPLLFCTSGWYSYIAYIMVLTFESFDWSSRLMVRTPKLLPQPFLLSCRHANFCSICMLVFNGLFVKFNKITVIVSFLQPFMFIRQWEQWPMQCVNLESTSWSIFNMWMQVSPHSILYGWESMESCHGKENCWYKCTTAYLHVGSI